MAALSIGAGAAVSNFGPIAKHQGTGILVGLAVVAFAAVVARGPVACLVGLAAIAAAGARTSLVSVGGFNVTLADPFYAGAFCWWAGAAIGRLVEPPVRRLPTPRFGQRAVFVFLGVSAVSLAHIYLVDRGHLTISGISWLRFAQTVSIAFLAAVLLRSRRDVEAVIVAITLGGLVAIGSAVVEVVVDGKSPADRIGGLQGVNAVGLVSAIVAVIAVFGMQGRRTGWRLFVFATAMIGLLAGKSVGSFVGVAAALALGWTFRNRAVGVQRFATAALAGAITLALLVGTIQWLRPSAAPGASGYGASSTSQRVILGAAGIEILKRNPIQGVGWRRSETPEVIGALDISIELHNRFQGAKPEFFPDAHPASVHNTYLQILADLGIVGFVAFITMLLAVGLGARRLLRDLGRDHPLWPAAFTISTALVVVLVWLNDNPLYGGQPETVLSALLVGCLVAMARMRIRERAEAAAAGGGTTP